MKINKKNILYAFGQVVLIVLGVSIATWVDNANQDSKDQKFEKTVLKEMLHNLQADTSWITNENRILERGVHAGERILTLLTEKSDHQDSINVYMIRIMWYSTAIYNTSAYETIKSKGLDLIRNDDLRQKITAYYESRLKDNIETKKLGYNVAWNVYSPMVLSRFKDFSISHGTAPVNLEALRYDEQFKQFLNLTIEFKLLEIHGFRSLKKSAFELIKALDAEVN